MNEIRKNKNEENVLLQVKFDMPKILKIYYIAIIIIMAFVAIISFIVSYISGVEMGAIVDNKNAGVSYGLSAGVAAAIVPLLLSVAVIVVYNLHRKVIKQSECTITNKGIKGVSVGLLAKKHYTYRLDEIDNVEITSVLGVSGLAILFSQGNLSFGRSVVYGQGQQTMKGTNIFRIYYLVDLQNVYAQLSDLLTSVKNQIDVAIDIEMKKIELEERKTDAFELVASASANGNAAANSSDIDKLERLAQMKEKGIISEAEYEIKKQELLSRL